MKLNLYSFIKKEYILLYFIILVGAFLRLQGVFTNSFAFTYDVGRDMLALWNIAYLHKVPLIGATTGLPGVFYGPWWYLFLTPFFIIFSGNPQGIAFIMSLIGVLTIFFAFILGKKIEGNLLGISLASIVSVSPVMISLSAQIWNPNISPFFVILSLLSLHKIFEETKKNKQKYYFLLGLLLSIIIDLEIVFGILFSIGIIISIIFIVKKNISLKSVIYFILGELIIFSPRILFELRHQFLMTKSFIKYFSGGNSSHNNLSFLNIFIDRLNSLFNQFNSTIFLENKFLGIIAIIFIFFTILFSYKKLTPSIAKFIKTSIIVIFVFLIGTTFFSHDIWPHYLVGLPVFYILLFSLCIYLLSKNLKSNIIPEIIVCLIVIFNFNPISFYQNISKPLWIGDASVYRNQFAVIDYVYIHAKGSSFKYVVYTPPVYDYTYQYLFLWYGPKKYHYSSSIQSNLAFFILEPDYQFPTRLTDWLKQRQGDGKIIKSEKLPSGIIVQTRLH
jgi:4-amino-4-deoxy-L-arabinose transferase-like glycosyltransferase